MAGSRRDLCYAGAHGAGADDGYNVSFLQFGHSCLLPGAVRLSVILVKSMPIWIGLMIAFMQGEPIR